MRARLRSATALVFWRNRASRHERVRRETKGRSETSGDLSSSSRSSPVFRSLSRDSRLFFPLRIAFPRVRSDFTILARFANVNSVRNKGETIFVYSFVLLNAASCMRRSRRSFESGRIATASDVRSYRHDATKKRVSRIRSRFPTSTSASSSSNRSA